MRVREMNVGNDTEGVCRTVKVRMQRQKLLVSFFFLAGVEPRLFNCDLDAAHILLHVLTVELRGLCIGGTSEGSATTGVKMVVGAPVGVWVMKEALDGRQDGGDVVCGAPPVLEDVEAELAIGVNVWMEHAGEEFDLRRFVRV